MTRPEGAKMIEEQVRSRVVLPGNVVTLTVQERDELLALAEKYHEMAAMMADAMNELQTLRGEHERLQTETAKKFAIYEQIDAFANRRIARLTQEKAALEARPVRVFNDNRDDLCAYILELEARERALVEIAKYARIAVNQIICLGGDADCQPCQNREQLAQALAALAPRPRHE